MKTLIELKPGDLVICSSRHHAESIRKVERVTKTMIVVDGMKFSARTGRIVGSDIWNYSSIDPTDPTDDNYKTIRAQNETNQVRKQVVEYLKDKTAAEYLNLWKSIAAVTAEYERTRNEPVS